MLDIEVFHCKVVNRFLPISFLFDSGVHWYESYPFLFVLLIGVLTEKILILYRSIKCL